MKKDLRLGKIWKFIVLVPLIPVFEDEAERFVVTPWPISPTILLNKQDVFSRVLHFCSYTCIFMIL